MFDAGYSRNLSGADVNDVLGWDGARRHDAQSRPKRAYAWPSLHSDEVDIFFGGYQTLGECARGG
jgi:hypothetical protein